jgi:hypothetical protein
VTIYQITEHNNTTHQSCQNINWFLWNFTTSQFHFAAFPDYSTVIKQETNCYMQKDVQTRNKPDIPDHWQICMNNLHAFLAITVQMGHDHNPSMKLYWAKDELSVLLSIPMWCYMIILSRFWNIWTPWTNITHHYKKIPIMVDYGKSDKHLTS